MSALSGKRILITRPRHQANTFAEALQVQGAQPVYLPTIQISPVEDTTCLDRALAHLDKYDWLVLTSANAVEVVCERLNAMEIKPDSPPLKVAAIGPKTAAALEACGVSPNFMPSEHISEAILPGLGDLHERWVLLPLADIAQNTLPNAIQDAGGISHVVIAYHTVPAMPDPEGLAEIQAGVDVITFTSGSTARNFVELTQNAGLDPFDLPGNPIIACIGPKTAQAAGEVGIMVDIVAEEYTTERLVEAIANHLSRI